MTDAQTEARAIAQRLMLPDEDVFELAVDIIATAILALQGERDEQWRRANVLAQQNAYHKDRAEAAEARVAELEKALESAREIVDACAGDNRPAIEWASEVREKIDAARRVREGGKTDG